MPSPSQPKRHHWWPQAQSRFWVDDSGTVCVTRQDGSSFRTNPTNIGVESELYTRFAEDGTKDTSIEDWFAEAIDAPAKTIIEHFLEKSNIRRVPFQGRRAEAEFAQKVGYRINPYVDLCSAPTPVRQAVAAYAAALVVRHPTYIQKLAALNGIASANHLDAKNRTLDNMLSMFDLFSAAMRNAELMLDRRVGTHEYLFADGGVLVTEQWTGESGIPFTIAAPLTPDISLTVFPMPFATNIPGISIAEATNQAVARNNRITLGAAKRFVFSRSPVSSAFVTDHFGKPPPNDIAFRAVNGTFEARWSTPDELQRR
jgi:hypothetical protein